MEGYLWLAGGNKWENSKEEESDLIAREGRWEVNDSHIMNKKKKTLTIETREPSLAMKFHLMYISG